jgi:hypothetical protein
MSDSEYLYGIFGVLIGFSINQIVKAFNLLFKYSIILPEHKIRHEEPNISLIKIISNALVNNRWTWRWFWFFHVSALLFQFIWGLKSKIPEFDDLKFFLFFMTISGLMYSLIVYVFPESLEEIYKNDVNRLNVKTDSKENILEKEKSNNFIFISKLRGLYFIYLIWIISTIVSNYYFFKDSIDYWGLSMKVGCIFIVIYSLTDKFYFTGENKKISWYDYLLIILSTAMLIYYTDKRNIKNTNLESTKSEIILNDKIDLYGEVTNLKNEDLQGAEIRLKINEIVRRTISDDSGDFHFEIFHSNGIEYPVIACIEVEKNNIQARKTVIIRQSGKLEVALNLASF